MQDVSILHIADLHYESPNSNYQDDNKAEVPDAMRATAFRSLNAILRYGFAGKACPAATVGGNITTQGLADNELALAKPAKSHGLR